MSYFSQIMELEKERDQVGADFSVHFIVFNLMHVIHANVAASHPFSTVIVSTGSA